MQDPIGRSLVEFRSTSGFGYRVFAQSWNLAAIPRVGEFVILPMHTGRVLSVHHEFLTTDSHKIVVTLSEQ